MQSTNPRQIAKNLIRPYVKNESVAQLADSYLGHASADYNAQVGGYAWSNGQSTKLGHFQVAVTRIQGKDCLYIFDLEELYKEIETGEQLSLFERG